MNSIIRKITPGILYILFLVAICTNMHAQGVFSDKYNFTDIDRDEYFVWKENAKTDTITISLRDTLLRVQGYVIGDFYLNLKELNNFLFLELLVLDPGTQEDQFPLICSIEDNTLNYLPETGKRTDGKWRGQFHNVKKDIKQNTFVILSPTNLSNRLHLVIL